MGTFGLIPSKFWRNFLLHISHSRIGHYFFSYLLTCEVYLIEVLELMGQMLQYILVVVGLSGILKAKQKLGVTFNFDKQDIIDFTKF